MKKLLFVLVPCVMTLFAYSAVGQETKRKHRPFKELRSSATLVVNTATLESLPLPSKLELACSGSVAVPFPSIGDCPPPSAGYTTVGFATCYQYYLIPKKYSLKELDGGFSKMICTLDLENREAIGELNCDYSQCFYIEEPTFLGTLVE